MKKNTIFLLLMYLFVSVQGQRDASWMLGYDYNIPPYPNGPMRLDFGANNTVNIVSLPDTTDFYETNASICDTNGNLLFYTNGISVRNKNHNIMQNGDSINYCEFWEVWKNAGMPIRQGALILPFPMHPNEYYILHNTLSEYVQGNYYPTQMLYSKVDMSLNQGLGAVVAKNQVLVDNDMADYSITACRHGNGRDWWLLFQEKQTNCYYRFLLNPNGLEDKGKQCLDGIIFDGVWQEKYSPDGTLYARFVLDTLYLMDFDRCNGLLSNPRTALLPNSAGCGGLEFSSNSRYLYAMNCNEVFQFDMQATNITNSRIKVGQTDGVLDPYNAASLYIASLAPNNKIYITTTSSVQSLSVIHSPDSAGLACNFQMRGLPLPRLNATVPNFPNFRLGAAFGSGCDSLGVSYQSSVNSEQSKVYPNPAQGFVYVDIGKAQGATFMLYDLSGREVFSQAFVGSNTKIMLGKLPKGAYFYGISVNNKQEYGKLLIE